MFEKLYFFLVYQIINRLARLELLTNWNSVQIMEKSRRNLRSNFV